jgi:adenosylhomocysteine nucleosidase
LADHRHEERPIAIHQGLIASGDRFVSGLAEVTALVKGLRDSGHDPLAVEMEGAAVAQVCADHGIPFVAMRTISDRADDTAHADFNRFVQDVASVYAQKVITHYLRNLPTQS